MRKTFLNSVSGFLMCASLMLASCRTACEVTQVEGERVPIDASWDALADPEMAAMIAPYREKMDSMMHRVVGVSALSMDRERPESLLSNLVADVLRQAAIPLQGKQADMGLINIGGLRNVLTAGEVTCEDIYEILPFENSLCVLTLKGNVLKQLFENIAARGGEGVSGVCLKISKDGKLLEASIGGRPVEEEKLYTLATIDYLAEGNDGMTALTQAQERICPEGATLRGLFMDYVEQEAVAGRKLSAKMEGRITIVTP